MPSWALCSPPHSHTAGAIDRAAIAAAATAGRQATIAEMKKSHPLPAGKNYLTGDGVHLTPEGNQLMARTVLAAFGLNDAQLTKAREAWLDLPGAGAFTTRADIELNKKFFTASCTLTLRQREKVLAAAAAANRPTLSHWSKELLLSLMKRKVKPEGPFESLDALFAPDVKDKVQAELKAEFVAEIEKIVR